MLTPWSQAYKKKFIHPKQLEKKVEELRENGFKIATLNGSFDLLHAGHLQIIFEASQVADQLIVALNTDESIHSYKGPHRPLVPLEYRLQIMAALEFVNYVTWFNESDPRDILEVIKPDVHVNGAEWGENCIEATVVKKYGGSIHIVSLVPGLSTSQIVNKIKEGMPTLQAAGG